MTDHLLIGRHVSEILSLFGSQLAVPDRPPEGDPDYGLDCHIEYPEHGSAVMIDDSDVCTCVQFFGAGKDPAYQPCAGELPGGVRFENSRDNVRTIMGPLVRSSDGGATVSWIEPRPWDLFTRDRLRVHLEYTESYSCILMASRLQNGIPEAYAAWAKQVFTAAPQQPAEVTVAADVAEAVWQAVTDASSPFRIPAGAGAVTLAA